MCIMKYKFFIRLSLNIIYYFLELFYLMFKFKSIPNFFLLRLMLIKTLERIIEIIGIIILYKCDANKTINSFATLHIALHNIV